MILTATDVSDIVVEVRLTRLRLCEDLSKHWLWSPYLVSCRVSWRTIILYGTLAANDNTEGKKHIVHRRHTCPCPRASNSSPFDQSSSPGGPVQFGPPSSPAALSKSALGYGGTVITCRISE